jgi:hypothetical protein
MSFASDFWLWTAVLLVFAGPYARLGLQSVRGY